MARPPLEVADLVRPAGTAFIERSRNWIGWKHIKVLLAIARCRTAAIACGNGPAGRRSARPKSSRTERSEAQKEIVRRATQCL